MYQRRCAIAYVQSQPGRFTLIEVMIAVAIVAIGVLCDPNFTLWYVQTQLRQATLEVASQLTLLVWLDGPK